MRDKALQISIMNAERLHMAATRDNSEAIAFMEQMKRKYKMPDYIPTFLWMTEAELDIYEKLLQHHPCYN